MKNWVIALIILILPLITYYFLDKNMTNNSANAFNELHIQNSGNVVFKTALYSLNINEDVVINEENNTVYLRDGIMRLDVGGVAKGCAVEQVAQWMEEEGYNGYILNVGGNVRCVGKRADGEKWKVGIESPYTDNVEIPYIEYLSIDNMSLVTSGSYQRFYVVKGNSYHHIIDPVTLMPAENFWSVSVLCKDSGLADALSTALFTMDYEQGLEIIESTAGAEAMWFTKDGEKQYSSGFKNYCVEE